MMQFIWDPKYSVSIKSIDAQHQKFFDIINQLYYLAKTNQITSETLQTAVKKFQDYANTHLAYEEKYFTEFDYPNAAKHIAAHDLFRQKITQYMAQCLQPQINVAKLLNEIADFSRDWISGHILALDQKYSQFFLQHDLD